ncbi:MAG: hypothetical protein ILP09_02400 [Oscillospiraceae bacterium]|nr:hypothetical protein [Oscillospiraceae bacterium]
MDNIEWKCNKCDKPLKPRSTVFEYMGRSFSHEVLVCPGCGKVFIPQSLAEGRMAEVEEALEDK